MRGKPILLRPSGLRILALLVFLVLLEGAASATTIQYQLSSLGGSEYRYAYIDKGITVVIPEPHILLLFALGFGNPTVGCRRHPERSMTTASESRSR